MLYLSYAVSQLSFAPSDTRSLCWHFGAGTDVGARSGAIRPVCPLRLADKNKKERAAAHENTYKITYTFLDDHGGTDLFDLYLDFRTPVPIRTGCSGRPTTLVGGSLRRRVDPGYSAT